MFIIRKIGKTLRGQVKPYQIITAALLGALIGFAPPFMKAPLFMIGVILLLAVLNANFFIATFTAGVCKMLAMLLMPVSFELGLLLVDGPMQGLFKMLINAPVTALMGFDYYITSGGAVIALVLGTVMGLGYVKLISSFRKKMAKVEADSAKYASFVSKRSVRIFTWVLFGGKAKLSYAELAELKKFGNPIRPLGVVFAVLLVGLLFIVQQFFSGPLVTALLKGQLEEFYGATIDIENVDLDVVSGNVTVTGLQMADPDNLNNNLIQANRLTAVISTSDLLRKRITIDEIVVDEARQGAARTRPGVLIHGAPEPTPPATEGRSIEEWFAEARVWKDRLDTYRQWLERVQGPPKDEESQDTDEDWLRDWADRYGHADVRATHLIEGSPTVLVRRVDINKLHGTLPDGETLSIHAENLSTNPALVELPPRVTVNSSAGSFDLDLLVGRPSMPAEQSTLLLSIQNRSIDETMSGLDLGSDLELSGGTWAAVIDGTWSDLSGLDLPLLLTLQDTTLTLPGVNPVSGITMPVEFGVSGPMDAPGLTMDMEKFLASLRENVGDAMMNQYVGLAEGWASEQLGEVLDTQMINDLGINPGNLTGGLLDRIRGNGGGGNEEGGEEEAGPNTDELINRGINEGLNRFRNRD